MGKYAYEAIKFKELSDRFAYDGWAATAIQFEDAARDIQELCAELRMCRNELCLKCGKYHNAHKGACDGCRWKECVW